MIRGRHRGLPAAIDRAVMLPAKLQQTDDLIRENTLNRSEPLIVEGVRATLWQPAGIFGTSESQNNNFKAIRRD